MTKPKSHSPKVSTGVYDYLKTPRKQFAPYATSLAKGSNTRQIAGRDVSAKVEKAQAVNGGYSAEVSRGKRPVHKADPRSFKRV